MGENKFIKHLKGEDTAKSVLEIKNQRTTTSFANMPDGDTSNANDVYSDHRGNAIGVLKGTENWKLDGQTLVETTTVYGDGRDFTNSFSVFGNGLWVDATCTFATARRFSPNTKFVLKLCGHDLETVINHTVDFTLIVKFGVSNLISKTFTVTEQAFDFCKEFVIDFAESNSSTIKADAGSTMQVQLLCADPAAAAVLYNGMTVFTALQRRVDGEAVASDTKTFPEIEQDVDDINDEIDKINQDIDNLEKYVDKTFVLKVGDTMSGALNIADIASSNTPLLTLTHSNTTTYKWNIAPRYNSTTLSIYPGNTETNGFRFATTGFVPASNNARYLGSASLKWKGVYTAMINNGYDITVPVTSSADTFALVNKDIDPLQQQINHLQTIGRFLSFWDATTGLAQTNPQTSPYVYQTGDYFRVGVVAGPGGTNYKPSGSSYTIGVASTTVETERLSVGQVYYYDGANWALAAGGSVAIDETTITFNNNDEIQAVAVVDQNTGIVKTWTGTAAEYDAIVTKDPDTEYIIIDDIGDSATMIGEITEDVNELKAHEVIAFQAPTAQNNYTWYRKYADGWVEQGGITTNDEYTPVILPIPMQDTNYILLGQCEGLVVGNYNFVVMAKTATSFTADASYGGGVKRASWQVSGMAA